MYVPLRVHGWHSLLTGVDPPAHLLARAAELKLPALALADVDSLTGTTNFLRAAARQRRGEAPRPILGAEISDPTGEPGRVVALVRDEEGYRNLCKLVSARRLGEDPGEAGAELDGPERFDLVDATRRFAAGLTLLVDHPRLAFALAGRVPAERLLVAVSPAALGKRACGTSRDAPAPGDHGLAEAKVPPPARAATAGDLVESARVLGLATVAVPDVYFARPEGWEHHRVRTAIKHNALLCDLPHHWTAERPAHLPAPDEFARRFADLPDAPGPFARGGREAPGALARTLEVAAACRYVPPLGGVIFPDVELGEHETAYSKLVALAFDGAHRRYRPLRPEVVRRLDYELTAIDELGFAAYFLLVRKIADFARDRGIPHVGRGSAADSLVAYCLELTDADPLRYRLPFERFLNPARHDRPDIDLDFCWRRRDEVLEYVWEAFGAERTAMIATLNRFGLRAAFREAALAEGIPPVEVNRWSRRLPWLVANAGSTGIAFDGAGEGSAMEEEIEEERAGGPRTDEGGEGNPRAIEGFAAYAETERGAGGSPGWVGAVVGEKMLRAGEAGGAPRASDPAPGPRGTPARAALPADLADNPVAHSFLATPECRAFPFADPRYRRVLRIAAALLEAPRHLGLHPGGVVVAPGPITDLVSCQRAAKGVVMTQLDKDGVEAIGLVKMDLLGNRALTVIDDCLQSLAARGEMLDLAAIPEDDARTAQLLARGETLGCFQVESPGMRNLLKQTAARNMDDVIQAVALIRPGPAGSGMKDAYVRRFRGLEEPRPLHPRLTELLWETHGVMLYQEDIMQAVVLMAGLELSDADELRRALAKRRRGVLAELRDRYFAGCHGEGIAKKDAAHVWELVSNFSSFGFCKAHAVTYGRISYRTVHLKAHHPADYLVAFLNSETGYYATRVYIEEARRLGVPILPPDVNRSAREFTLETRDDARPAIRVGLHRVKGLTARTTDAILEERERGGAFLSLPDFLTRSRARVDETETLIQCGAFDAFDRTRPEMLWRLHLLSAPPRRAPRDLDPNLLAACRETPEKRALGTADAARAQTGGWSRSGMGVGSLDLARGENASLFAEPPTPALALPRLPETDDVTRGRRELELLGLNVTRHPTTLFPCEGEERAAEAGRRPPPTIPCGSLDEHRGEEVSLRGWLAASRRVRTSDGRWMRFLTLEDVSGIAEVVLFADPYERHGHHLVHHGPHLVTGIVEDQLGSCTLHCSRVW